MTAFASKQAVARESPPAAQAPIVQRKCAQCRDDDEAHIQTKRSGTAPARSLDIGAAVRAAVQGGTPLSSDVRAYFEPRFGHDFSQVRVHADGEADRGARAIDARAYTIGRDVVFARGQYAPATSAGRKLLAHELTHVVQQQRGGPGLAPSGLSSPNDAAEREADVAAETVTAGRAFAPRAAPGVGLHRKMHNKVIQEPVRPKAQACLVHLHGEEKTAAAVGKELYGRRCVNYVHLDTTERRVEFDATVKGVQFTCRADPNRVFSDKGRRDDAIHKWGKKKIRKIDPRTKVEKEVEVDAKLVDCDPPAGADVSKITDADIETAAATELKTFTDGDWAAGISRCRGGKGTADLAGPLPVLALHNNEGGDKTSDAILTKYKGQWDPKDSRVGGVNPDYSADPGHPSDVFFVTQPKDFTAVKDTFNVGIQQATVPPAGEDGSLSVALQKQRFITSETKGRDHVALVPAGTGFQGHDAVYIKNYAMAVKALDVLGVSEGLCDASPAAAPKIEPPAPPKAAPADTKTDIDPAKAKAEEEKKKTEPYPYEKVAAADVPKGCFAFDVTSLEARRQHWAAQIRTLPVKDVINWIVGAWDFGAAGTDRKLPSVVRAAKDESFAQRACLVSAMQAGVKAQKGSVPKGDLIASGSRSFADQKGIWIRKWNFTGADFDRISKAAAAKSNGLLVEGKQWSPKNVQHQIMWGLPKPTDPKNPDLAAFVAAKAVPLTHPEREQEILEASSAPGVSRHHAGTDFDIGERGKDDLQDAFWKPGAKMFDAGRWLRHNAATWGFMRPFETKGGHGTGYMAEPWHWSYWPVAQALLEFARVNRTDMETELRAKWGSSGSARLEFVFIWNAWKNFIDNVDESPKF